MAPIPIQRNATQLASECPREPCFGKSFVVARMERREMRGKTARIPPAFTSVHPGYRPDLAFFAFGPNAEAYRVRAFGCQRRFRLERPISWYSGPSAPANV